MIVADTNIISYLALPSEYTSLAEKLLQRDPDWVAPFLWRSEFRNVLALYLRKGILGQEQIIRLQAEMEALFEGREYEAESRQVLSLVAGSERSAYDCEFVAIAQSLGVPLVTMDRKLATSFPGTAALLTDYVH